MNAAITEIDFVIEDGLLRISLQIWDGCDLCRLCGT